MFRLFKHEKKSIHICTMTNDGATYFMHDKLINEKLKN